MYTSYRTVSRAQGWDDKTKENGAINKLRHRGMQKSHIQVTPDGKVIQHYRIDARTMQGKKLLKEALEKMEEERKAKEQEEVKQEDGGVEQ